MFAPICKLDLFLEIGDFLNKFVLRFLHENWPLKTNKEDELKPLIYFTPKYKSFVTY